MKKSYINAYLNALQESISILFGLEFFQTQESGASHEYSAADTDLIVNIPFSGPLTGDYFLFVQQSEWELLLGHLSPEDEEEENFLFSCLKELLNTAVGKSISILAEDYPHLTFTSPRIFRSLLDYPKTDSSGGVLKSESGQIIHVRININKMQQAIDQRLSQEILQKNKAIQLAAELEEAKLLLEKKTARNLETMKMLKESRKTIQAAAEAKSRFLAFMSHELRTPLNGIIGVIDVMDQDGVSEEQKENLETIEYSANSLLNIINDVLDFSKIEAGKVELEKIRFNFKKLVENIADLLAPKAIEREVDLVARFDPQLPTHFIGDPNRIRQILINLVGNAIKFTTNGHVFLNVIGKKFVDGQWNVGISIEDTGIGIPESRLASIFDQYSQAESSTTRKFGGTGLGLSISKSFVELMDGELSVESQYGSGTTFNISIRLEKDPQSKVQPMPCYSRSSAILCVKPGVFFDVFCEQLEGMEIGWQVDTSKAGIQRSLMQDSNEETQSVFYVFDFDSYPEIAENFIAKLNLEPGAKALSVLLISKFRSSKRIRELWRLQNIEVLFKPIHSWKLMEKIEILLKDPNKQSLKSTSVNKLPKLQQIGKNRKALLVEDNPVNQKVATKVMENLGFLVEIAVNGVEALKKSRNHTYDLIFMDCLMPEMDGYEATKAIRKAENPESPSKIIAMTANAQRGDKDKCLEAGMNDYITKPIKREVLEKICKRWL